MSLPLTIAGFTEAQQALWDASVSHLPWAISREAVDYLSFECHAKRCSGHHPTPDEMIELLWSAFCDALQHRAMFLEDGKGTE